MPTQSHQKEEEDMAVHIFAQIEIQDADTYRALLERFATRSVAGEVME